VVSSEDRLRAARDRLTLLEAFGARLRALRMACGLSPRRLAEKCRLSTSTIRKAERGRYEPRLCVLVILCDGLGRSPSELLGDLPVPQRRSAR
jgi:transcriptional regulator with XRE-family HTH domain